MTPLPPDVLELLDAPAEAEPLARELGAMARDGSGSLVTAAVLAVLAAEGRGDAWVDLADPVFARVLALVGADGRDVEARLLASGLVGAPGEALPLVVDDGRLRSHRVEVEEARVARAVKARLERSPALPGAGDALRDVLARPSRRGGHDVVLDPTQVRAIETLLGPRLAVLSGGPGTGKTSVVVSVLRTLARLGVPASDVALAAPTGKAAQRLAESIESGLAALADPSAHDLALRDGLAPPSTLHKLLRHSPSRGTFGRHQGAPLSAGWVVVDEASMLDLLLFDRLLGALRPDARLLLVGDVHQLPSVGVGDVLRDLAAAGVPLAELTESHRMRAGDPHGAAVLAASRAVLAGSDPFSAHAPVRAPTFRGIERVASMADLRDHLVPHRDPRVAKLAAGTYDAQDGGLAPDAEARFRELSALLSRRRVLCPGRRTPGGANDQNRALHELVQRTRPSRVDGPFVPGEPVLVTRNDHERGLVNGDVGVALWVQDGGRRRLSVVIGRPDGARVFPVDRVREVTELAHALTVHKSQGSEHDEIVLVLPEDEASRRLLSRELVYTAVTRARAGLVVVGDTRGLADVLSGGAGRRSGLRPRLG